LTRKTRPRYDYNVFSGTLNPTQSINSTPGSARTAPLSDAMRYGI